MAVLWNKNGVSGVRCAGLFSKKLSKFISPFLHATKTCFFISNLRVLFFIICRYDFVSLNQELNVVVMNVSFSFPLISIYFRIYYKQIIAREGNEVDMRYMINKVKVFLFHDPEILHFPNLHFMFSCI